MPRIQGRHEKSAACKRIARPTIEYFDGPEPGSVTLRIDDLDNPAFWLEIILTSQELNELQVRAIQANMPAPPIADGFEWRSGAFKND